MPGFYVRHLRSHQAREYAQTIEQNFKNPTADLDNNVTAIVNTSGTKAQNGKDVFNAAYAVLRDNPDIFYLDNTFTSFSYGKTSGIRTHLLYSAKEIDNYRKRLDAQATQILQKYVNGRTVWEKECQLFEYFQKQVDYIDDNSRESHNILGPILFGKGVCEGISKAFAWLCHKIGIPCIVVFDSNHMWNIVSIDGHPTHVDATWGTESRAICDYTYFNISDNEIYRDHNKSLDCLPVCKATDLDFFQKNQIYFESEQSLKRYIGEQLDRKENLIYVKLKSGNILEPVENAVKHSGKSVRYYYNEKQRTAIIQITGGVNYAKA